MAIKITPRLTSGHSLTLEFLNAIIRVQSTSKSILVNFGDQPETLYGGQVSRVFTIFYAPFRCQKTQRNILQSIFVEFLHHFEYEWHLKQKMSIDFKYIIQLHSTNDDKVKEGKIYFILLVEKTSLNSLLSKMMEWQKRKIVSPFKLQSNGQIYRPSAYTEDNRAVS